MEQPDEDISLQDLLSEDSEVDEDANFDDGDMVDHE